MLDDVAELEPVRKAMGLVCTSWRRVLLYKATPKGGYHVID